MKLLRNMTPARRDFSVLLILSALVMFIFKQTKFEPWWVNILRSSSKFERDDVLMTLFILLIASSTFAILRWRESRKANIELEALAIHDPLTGILNRRGFLSQGAKLLGKCNEVCLIFIDSDRFKFVNDTFGHLTGNQLLIEIAKRIQQVTPLGTCIARLGGDEFAILAEMPPNLSDVLSKNLQAIFNKEFLIENHSIRVTASLGVSFYPRDGRTLSEMLQASDLAMYEAKKRKGNSITIYNDGLRSNLEHWMNFTNDVQRALQNDEFSMVYQPIVHLKTGKVLGYEGLIRWNHPTKGLVLPDSFIKLAEESSLILDIGDCVIRKILSHKKECNSRGLSHIRFGINVSPAQFYDGRFIQTLEREIREHGIHPGSVTVEITESMMLPQDDVIVERIGQLNKIGCRLSIDDFGAGYASIHYLTTINANSIKIDRSIVSQIDKDTRSLIVCRAIIQLAHQLGAVVIGEGVETTSQLRTLSQLDCDYGQGYLFGKPKPINELEAPSFLHNIEDSPAINQQIYQNEIVLS